MKIKFHKGPFHSQVRDIDPTFAYPRLNISVPKRNRSDYAIYRNAGKTYDFAFEERRGYYEVKMMRLTIGGLTYQAPAMHPDGMVYYVWKGYEK